MLPNVVIQRKRSSSKTSINSTSSPYAESVSRHQKNRTQTSFKFISPVNIRSSVNLSIESSKLREWRSSLRKNEDFELTITQKAAELEEEYNLKLDRFLKGDREYLNELEIIDHIFLQIANFAKPFENLLNVFRQKINQHAFENMQEKFEKKIRKIKEMNSSLIQKINSLAEINGNLVEENKKLKASKADFERLFVDQPDVLLNYQNIVEQMLKQCDTIVELKKELKKTRRYKELYETFMEENLNRSISFIAE